MQPCEVQQGEAQSPALEKEPQHRDMLGAPAQKVVLQKRNWGSQQRALAALDKVLPAD